MQGRNEPLTSLILIFPKYPSAQPLCDPPSPSLSIPFSLSLSLSLSLTCPLLYASVVTFLYHLSVCPLFFSLLFAFPASSKGRKHARERKYPARSWTGLGWPAGAEYTAAGNPRPLAAVSQRKVLKVGGGWCEQQATEFFFLPIAYSSTEGTRTPPLLSQPSWQLAEQTW